MQVDAEMHDSQFFSAGLGMTGFKRPFLSMLDRFHALATRFTGVAFRLEFLHFPFDISDFDIEKHVVRPLAAGRVALHQLLNAFFMVGVARIDFASPSRLRAVVVTKIVISTCPRWLASLVALMNRQNHVAILAADAHIAQMIVRDIPDEIGDPVEL